MAAAHEITFILNCCCSLDIYEHAAAVFVGTNTEITVFVVMQDYLGFLTFPGLLLEKH